MVFMIFILSAFTRLTQRAFSLQIVSHHDLVNAALLSEDF